ncbi:hypothetical protein ACUOBA_40040, partial [Escherichia coli]
DKEIARGELVELMADKVLPVEMPFSAVYYSDRAVSTRIRAFIDFLSEHVVGQTRNPVATQAKLFQCFPTIG